MDSLLGTILGAVLNYENSEGKIVEQQIVARKPDSRMGRCPRFAGKGSGLRDLESGIILKCEC